MKTNDPAKDSALRNAAIAGDAALCAALIDDGASVDIGNPSGNSWPPLFWAAYEGHARTCQVLIDKGASVNTRINSGSTALHHAAQEGKVDAVLSLIQAGADPGIKNNANLDPFLLAALFGKDEVCEVLLNKGADPHVQDSGGQGALHLAAGYCRLSTCVCLIGWGLSPSAVCRKLRTPLHAAAQNKASDVCEALARLDSPMNPKDQHGKTPLDLAVGEAATTRVLIAYGADPRGRQFQEIQSLSMEHAAVMGNLTGRLAELLEDRWAMPASPLGDKSAENPEFTTSRPAGSSVHRFNPRPSLEDLMQLAKIHRCGESLALIESFMARRAIQKAFEDLALERAIKPV